MRALLINPFYPISETPSPPLGLAYLAAALEQAGIEVKIMDLVVFPYSFEMLKGVLDEFEPDLVGATSVTMTFDNAMSVLRDVKKINPNLFTVMGGPHVSFCALDTLKQEPALDAVVLGEGEESVVSLAQAVTRCSGFENIPGLAYRSEGRVLMTGERRPGLDLDSLPVPARSLLPLGRYRALGMAISMTTSRGCPFQCIFCVGRKMVGSRVRYRKPSLVVDELEQIGSLGFSQVNIADDLFTANKRHCREVCEEILRRGLKIKWTSFARVDTVSPEILSIMKEAGCSAVSFGVETGDPEIMKTIRKGITLDQVEAAVKMCIDAEVMPHASFILGLPGETPQTLETTVAFGEKLKGLGVSHGFHLLAPFPGTRVREEHESFGLKILTDDWSQYHANRAIVETDSVSASELDEIAIKWERDFDEYLGYLKKRIESGEADEEEAWPLVNLERIVLVYDLMMGRVMEEVGAWPAVLGRDPLEMLIERVSNAVDGRPEHVAEVLKWSVEKGHLRQAENNGQIRWEWVDFF